jgi:hypothetical protein
MEYAWGFDHGSSGPVRPALRGPVTMGTAPHRPCLRARCASSPPRDNADYALPGAESPDTGAAPAKAPVPPPPSTGTGGG